MTYDYSKLRGKIKECYNTEMNFADKIKMGRVSLSQRLNNKLEFTQNDIKKCCEALGIEPVHIPDYFFCPVSSETRTVDGE